MKKSIIVCGLLVAFFLVGWSAQAQAQLSAQQSKKFATLLKKRNTTIGVLQLQLKRYARVLTVKRSDRVTHKLRTFLKKQRLQLARRTTLLRLRAANIRRVRKHIIAQQRVAKVAVKYSAKMRYTVRLVRMGTIYKTKKIVLRRRLSPLQLRKYRIYLARTNRLLRKRESFFRRGIQRHIRNIKFLRTLNARLPRIVRGMHTVKRHRIQIKKSNTIRTIKLR